MQGFPFGLTVLLVVAQPVVPAQQSPANQGGWRDALRKHLAAHPRSEAEDVYKFIHQSVFGPAHLVLDPARARAYLKSEIEGMGTVSRAEPLFEKLGGEPSHVRVNLRPYLARGGDPENLLNALILTVSAGKAEPGSMPLRMQQAARMLREQGQVDLSAKLTALAEVKAQKGFEAVHHSESYRRAYRPAYRVVREDLAQALMGNFE